MSIIQVAAARQPPHAPLQLVGWGSNQLQTSISGCLSSESLGDSSPFISFPVTSPSLVFFLSSPLSPFLAWGRLLVSWMEWHTCSPYLTGGLVCLLGHPSFLAWGFISSSLEPGFSVGSFFSISGPGLSSFVDSCTIDPGLESLIVSWRVGLFNSLFLYNCSNPLAQCSNIGVNSVASVLCAFSLFTAPFMLGLLIASLDPGACPTATGHGFSLHSF